MALKEFPELFEVFKKLQAEKAEIQSRSGPLREERDRIVAQTAPFEARARELAREGVRVNAIAPGFIETPLTAALPADVLAQANREVLLGRIGRPADIGNAVLFLASPLASHITGQVLVVDGGQLI